MDEQHRSFDVGDDLRWTHSGEIDTRPPPYGEKKRIPQHPVAAARAQQAAGRIPKISKRSIERKGGQLIVGRGRIDGRRRTVRRPEHDHTSWIDPGMAASPAQHRGHVVALVDRVGDVVTFARAAPAQIHHQQTVAAVIPVLGTVLERLKPRRVRTVDENADAPVTALGRRNEPTSQEVATVGLDLHLLVRKLEIARVAHERAQPHGHRARLLSRRYRRDRDRLAGRVVLHEVAHELVRRVEGLAVDSGDDIAASETELTRHLPRTHDAEPGGIR